MNRRAIGIIICLVVFNLVFVSAAVAGLRFYAPRPNREAPVSLQGNGGDTAVYQFSNHLPQGSGGGEYFFPDDHISDAQRQQIESQLQASVQQLQDQGTLPLAFAPETVSFGWPVQAAPHLDDFGYHGMSNFVDHNPNYPYQRLDYACGQRTYDTYSGYNHPGSDIFSWPFPWSRMDNNEIMVVAAAAGVIVLRQDGNFDRNCSFTGLPWNAIHIQHSDGSIAWYGHMKNGSLTSKQVGQWVAQGEYLGVVGSSGSSTGPHLHFEVQTITGQILDPYAGTCNNMNPNSLWVEQPPYYDTAVNKITTGYAAPLITECSTPEQSHEADSFNPGDTIYFTTYYRDQLASLPSQYTIYRPNGSVYQSWQHNIPDPHYAASWWWWSFALPTNAPQGYWQFAVTVNNQTVQHTFLVGSPPPPTPTPIPTPVPTPALITVTAPNGGELFAPGDVLSVTWQTVLTPAMQVDLLPNAQVSHTLTITGYNPFTWTIPLSMSTNLYTIRVSNTLSPTQYDESDSSFIIGILDHHHFLPVLLKPDP
ncbi:MAG: peptidoglycan DD-metalloendopeptidase family protein [Anaerolineae bacterium]|nr:peptidoglycan DD-metalloendopeptidase family protein [Anaerolineae bacterium]